MKRFECSAVLFDLDGVLVDSTAYVEQQWRRWASARGLRPEPFLRVCHGRRALETIRMAAPDLDAEAEVRRSFRRRRPRPSRWARCPARCACSTALPKRSWAVATSGVRHIATARLRRAGLPVPPVLVCAEDVTRGKPNPDAYLLAARELGRLATRLPGGRGRAGRRAGGAGGGHDRRRAHHDAPGRPARRRCLCRIARRASISAGSIRAPMGTTGWRSWSSSPSGVPTRDSEYRRPASHRDAGRMKWSAPSHPGRG